MLEARNSIDNTTPEQKDFQSRRDNFGRFFGALDQCVGFFPADSSVRQDALQLRLSIGDFFKDPARLEQDSKNLLGRVRETILTEQHLSSSEGRTALNDFCAVLRRMAGFEYAAADFQSWINDRSQTVPHKSTEETRQELARRVFEQHDNGTAEPPSPLIGR